MRLKYFIDFKFEETIQQFLPVGIWIQDVDDLGIDMWYPDETSSQYWETQWIINRLVESDLNAPADFLKHHQAKAGYKGMRSKVFEVETELGVDEFMRNTLKKFLVGGN